MIRRCLAAVCSVAVVFACTSALFGQGDIIINIYEPGMTKIKIGVPPPVAEESSSPSAHVSLANDFARVIRDDLDFTGLFEVFTTPPPHTGAPASPSPFPPLKAWTPLGVQSVVQSQYQVAGSQVRYDCALYDVESQSRIVGRYYKALPSEVRMVAHAFADEIVYRYTGKRGVAHTSLAYVKKVGDVKEIHLMDYDGHNSYQLTHDKSIALSPAWSPDGNRIVFTSYKDYNPDVYMIDLKKRSYTRISGFIGLNTTPAFSPDGKHVALTLSKDGNPEIYILDLRTGEFSRLTKNSRIDTSPSWSPNGREFAFVSDRSGAPQIYITDREGINLRRLTYSGYYNTSPAWSPLGDKIAYVGMAGGSADIYTISPTGSELRRLTYDGGNEDPSWSPDGKYLAYASKRGGNMNIYLMRENGTGRRQVTFGGGDNMAPAWSP